MKIVFLDVDGVLNSMAYLDTAQHKEKRKFIHDEIDETRVVLLKQLIDATDAKIVLSSTWRQLKGEEHTECDVMYSYLVDTLKTYGINIMSSTPVIGLNRPLEILTWINNRVDKENIRFVSLDDDFRREDYDEYGIGENLIQTIFFTNDIEKGGLQQEHVKKAIELLNGGK